MASTYLPMLPDSKITPEIPTFKDMVDFLIVYAGRSSMTDRDRELATRSVQAAYRELLGRHSWKWYDRKCIVPTSADTEITGASYSATTNAFTVTAGDAPSWARDGSIQITSGTYEGEYEIQRVESGADDVIYLRHNQAIGTDITSQDITIVRRRYPLPIDFNAEKSVYDQKEDRQLKRFIAHEEHVQGPWMRRTPSDPIAYVIRWGRSAIYRSIELTPPPTDARTISISYRSRGRPLRNYEKIITLTASDDSVSSTLSESISDNFIGCVMRVNSDSEDTPTSLSGASPWTMQRFLIGLSGTTGTLDYATDAALTAEPAVLSDPLDIDPDLLMPAMEMIALKKFAQYTRSDDAAKIRDSDVERAFIKACQQDADAVYGDIVTEQYEFAVIEDYESYKS